MLEDQLQQAFVDFEKRFVAWAMTCDDIRAAIVIGSRARTDTPADAWSDIDIIMLVTEPERYINDTAWLDALGKVWATFLEPTATGDGTERRVLFAGGVDVDFVPIAPLTPQQIHQPGEIRQEIARMKARGVRILVDKDGLGPEIDGIEPLHPTSDQVVYSARFRNVANDYWYHLVWVVKKLRRGELWMALGGMSYLRWNCLLPLIEWHTWAMQPETDTWHSGRFMEQWAGSRLISRLNAVFAHYDTGDMWRAVFDMMELGQWLIPTIAHKLNFEGEVPDSTSICAWLQTCYDQQLARSANEG